MLSDKEIVNEIIGIEDIENKQIRIYSIIKSGVVSTCGPDKKLINYAKTLKAIFRHIQTVAKEREIEDVKELSKEDYKEFKNNIKEKIFKDIKDRIKTNSILEGISDIDDETLLKEYLR